MAPGGLDQEGEDISGLTVAAAVAGAWRGNRIRQSLWAERNCLDCTAWRAAMEKRTWTGLSWGALPR